MKRWRNRLIWLGGVAALATAIPAIGQQAPESVLPPGFGDPEQQPPQETPAPTEAPAEAAPGPSDGPAATQPSGRTGGSGGIAIDTVMEEDLLAAEELLNLPPPIEIPDAARRDPTFVGAIDETAGGLGADAYGRADGRFLSALMRRLDAPTPSRWGSMLLRRALLTGTPAPTGVNPADWVAERAWLLVRMGEADAARLLVQSVDVDRFTPKMFAIAVQTALATADPAALCPLVGPGQETSDEPVWPLADAICASLSGEPGRASSLIDGARRRGTSDRIDIDLAEKIVGAGANTRRAVTIEWDGVDTLSSWRFGLASATGLPIPDNLFATAGPHVRAWQARAPMLPLDQRVAAAQTAASLGVFSNAALVEIYSLLADETDPSEMADSVGGRLRVAYVGRTLEDRMRALRDLWDDGDGAVDRHARRILTATAASRVPARAELAADTENLIAAMLTAGYDREAARWGPVVDGLAPEQGAPAWAMLAVATPSPAVEITAARIEAFEAVDESERGHATKLLIAALAGLGRIDADASAAFAADRGLDFAPSSRWAKMLDRAAENRQPGTVALLAGIGMQTGDWRGVPAEHLFHIVRALSQVGLEYEARMIAAEAIARL